MIIIKLIFASFTFVQIQVNSIQTDKFSNHFHEINNQLLAVLDNVFIALKIDKNFTKSEGLADYMSIHNIIQDAVEKNDKKYDNIIETTKTEFCNKTAYFVWSINEFEDEMIRQQRFKYKTDVFNKTSDSSGNVLAEFINLGTGLNLKLNALSNDMKFWESELSKTSLTRRLYDGNLTLIRRFPFVASVHVDGQFNCAGSIIREDMVITAASCLTQFSRRFRATSIQVRVGSDYTNKEGELVSVTNIWFHPLFNQTTLNHNLAILQLKRRLELQRRKLITIRFDAEAEDMPESAKGVMALGWGDQRPNYKPSDTSHHLTKAFVHLYNLDDCMRIYSRTYVTPVSFCTGYNEKGSGACKNDIGGPAIIGSTLVGVISFGSPYCGRPQKPTVYTKLGYYAEWINMVFDKAPITSPLEMKKNDKTKESSNEIFGYSYKMSITEWFILKGIANDIQATRQNPVVRDFYGEIEELDTFKVPKIYSDAKNHPLVDKSIVLDPNLVDIPDFSDVSDVEGNLNIETDPPTPDAYKPFVKQEFNLEWDVYQSVVPNLISLAQTTEMTPPPPPPEPEAPFVWPPHLLNLTADEDAYDQFTFDPTEFLHKLTNPIPSINENNEQPPNEVKTGVQNEEVENTPTKEAAVNERESEANHLRLLQLEFQEPSRSRIKKKQGKRKPKNKSGKDLKENRFTRLYPIN